LIRDGVILAAAADAELADFYKTISAISFTLLGLWWVVAQVKYADWAVTPRRRRQAYAVSLYFLLPGVMTLLSAINSELGLLWRLAFGVAGAVGLIEVVLYATGGIRTAPATALRVCAVVLYLFIIVFAIHPPLSAALGLGLAPKEVESILVALLIVVGVNIAWFVFVEPSPTTRK
jgi:hypothetical protein